MFPSIMNFCMHRKSKKKRSNTSTSTSRHDSKSLRKLSRPRKKKKESGKSICESEKEMCNDIVQSYIKPKLIPLLTAIMTSSIQSETSTFFNAILKNGNEIIVDKKVADKLLKLDLCSEINPNLSNSKPTENQNDSFADDLIGGFEYDVTNSRKRAHRWEKLYSFWCFIQYLNGSTVPSVKVDEEYSKSPELVNKDSEQVQNEEPNNDEVEPEEIMQKQMIKSVSPSPRSSIDEYDKGSTDNNKLQVQQIAPEREQISTKLNIAKLDIFKQIPKLSLDRRKQQGIMALQPTRVFIQSTNRKRRSQPVTHNTRFKQNSHSSAPTPTPGTPIRQLDKIWSDYDNVQIPEPPDK